MYRPLSYVSLGLLLAAALPAQIITTVAGIDATFAGNGQPALSVPLGYINGVATDGAGNVYFTDPMEHLLLRVSANGTLTVIAGNGIAGYSGDGGPATSAAIAASDNPDQYVGAPFEDSLGGVAIDKSGNIYFGDSHRVRVIAGDGTISTVAGGGNQSPGDGGPGTQASLGIVNGLAFDAAGNLYFCESNRIRKLTPNGTLTTYAGGAANGFSGDGGPAQSALLSQPEGLAFDAQGNLYVADGDVANFPSRIREIKVNGIITTIAGAGNVIPANGAPPLSLNLSYASGLAVDSNNALYVLAPKNGYLLKIAGGTTTLITSPMVAAFTSNVPATSAFVVGQRVYDNSGIALDPAGNLYVADSRDGRLCKIDTHGTLTAIAGNGDYGYGGDGGPALGTMIQGPSQMTQAPDGTLYFLDTLNVRVRAIAPNGTISTAISAANFPPLGINELLNGITSDPSGNVYVLLAHRVIELTSSGSIQIVVNQTGTAIFGGDGGPAMNASFVSGGGLARDAAGNLYIADMAGNRIRKVTADGVMHTIAGTGASGVSPDGSAAASPISAPSALLPDAQGGLYFEEEQTLLPGGLVLRYITPSGTLKTIAGNLKGGFSGDGGPATQAGMGMQNRTGLAFDTAGNLYVADGFNHRVRVIAPNGIIGTFAGGGRATTAGDGGLAKNAGFSIPRGLLFDPHGNLFISDVAGNRIREVLNAPPAISATPSQMNFSADAGGALTPAQQLTIDGPVSGVGFTVQTSAGADWLVVGAGGLTPRLMQVRVDPSNLTPGAYQATLTITAPLANPVTSVVQVALQVGPGVSPVLATDKTALSFTFPRDPTTTGTQIVRVSNQGDGALNFSVAAQTAPGGNWLSVGTASGTATPQKPADVAVIVTPKGLATGTYTGTVTIASSTTATSIVIPVNLTVSTLDQAMRLSRPALSFTGVVAGGVVPPGVFAVNNIGRGTMNFSVSTRTLSGGQQWLAAAPTSGSNTNGQTPVPITVKVDQTGLAPGFYFGLVRVDSPTAANSPQVLTIALLVLPRGQDPGPVIEPSELVFTTEAGAPPPGSRNLFVYNVSGTPQTYSSSITASDPNDQFSFIPGNSTLSLTHPTRVVVQPLTSGLAAGVYDAELTLQFSDGQVRRVGMRTIVTPASPTSALDDSTLPARDIARVTPGCTPTQLVPAITTLGQSFGVPAAWPVALEAQVTDDCGNVLDAGDVTASFSNGDPPLSLVPIQGGAWQSTWQSGNSAGPVTLTITAVDPTRNLMGTREVSGGLGSFSMAPVLSGAVSAASFAPHSPLSPGSIISLFGQNLGNGTAAASVIPLGTTLADATVLMGDNALPLLFGSKGQINAVVSAGIAANTSQQILVQRGNTLSIPIAVDVGPANPAVFPYPAAGDPPQQAAIVNALTYVVADPAAPVGVGDVLAIFCAGLGAVNQTIADGAAAPGSPPAKTVASAAVMIGGKTADVSFSGLAAGFAGLYQIDAKVPSGVTPGSEVPVIVSIAGQTSPPVTIAVK